MGTGDVGMEPCAVRVAGAHVAVVWAVVTVVIGVGAWLSRPPRER